MPRPLHSTSQPGIKLRFYLARPLAAAPKSLHVETVDGEAALAGARRENPELPSLENRLPEGFALGDAVTVTPVDYGRNPVAGTLAAWSTEEVVIARERPETGRVLVHFPSSGFEVNQAR